MAVDESANSTVRETIDRGRLAAETASQAIQNGIEAAQQYVQNKGFNFDMRDFVRREPWTAIAAAFVVGYVAAQIVRRVT